MKTQNQVGQADTRGAPDTRPGTPEFHALRSYAEKARIRGAMERALRADAPAILAALSKACDSLTYACGVLQAPERCAMREDLDEARALLAKHEGADR